MTGLDNVVTKDEEDSFPGIVARDTVDVIYTHQLPRLEPLEYLGTRSREGLQWHVGRAIAETFARRLQEVRFTRRGCAPDPRSLARRRIRERPQVVDEDLVPVG